MSAQADKTRPQSVAPLVFLKQQWHHKKRLETAKKAEDFPAWRIAKEKSRQEFAPLLGKYLDCVKAEPLHNTNNAWKQWFLAVLTVIMQYTNQSQLKASAIVSDLPVSSCLPKFLKCVRETVKCGRLFNSFLRWFSEKRKKGIQFSYRFTGLESMAPLKQLTILRLELQAAIHVSRPNAFKRRLGSRAKKLSSSPTVWSP